MDDYKRCYYLYNKKKLIEYSKNYYTYKKCGGDFTDEEISDNMKIFLSKYKKHKKKEILEEPKRNIRIQKGFLVLEFS